MLYQLHSIVDKDSYTPECAGSTQTDTTTMHDITPQEILSPCGDQIAQLICLGQREGQQTPGGSEEVPASSSQLCAALLVDITLHIPLC